METTNNQYVSGTNGGGSMIVAGHIDRRQSQLQIEST